MPRYTPRRCQALEQSRQLPRPHALADQQQVFYSPPLAPVIRTEQDGHVLEPQSAIRQFAGLIEDIDAAARVETLYVLPAYR